MNEISNRKLHAPEEKLYSEVQESPTEIQSKTPSKANTNLAKPSDTNDVNIKINGKQALRGILKNQI